MPKLSPLVLVFFFFHFALSLPSIHCLCAYFLLSPSPGTKQAVSTIITSVNTFALSGLLVLSVYVYVYGRVAVSAVEFSLKREFSNSF